MNTMPHPPTPASIGLPGATAGPVKAPTALRRRVLGAARHDVVSARVGGRGRHANRAAWAIASGSVALTVALALFIAFASVGHGGGTGSIGLRASAGLPGVQLRHVGPRGELDISGMSEPPNGEVYELWVNRASGPLEPTDALFTVTSSGDATVYIPGTLDGLREVAITAEPLGGSVSPTGPALLRVALAD